MNTSSAAHRLFLSLLVLAIAFLLLDRAAGAAEEQQRQQPFRAGAATSVITPPLGASLNGGMGDRRATHIHDELNARCLVLDDGTTRVAIVACDSCVIPREIFDRAKALAAERTGIPARHMLMCATHTHSAPTATAVFQSDPDPEYQRFLIGRIADGIARAVNNLMPARIGWAVGREPSCVFNRRWRMKPGAIPPDPFGGTSDEVRMNPPVGSADLVEPAGPTDPDVPVIATVSPDGRPIAVLANYTLHYVGGNGGGDVSADYYGVFADRVQALLGADRLDPPFVGIMTNGTSGDINNINFRGQPAGKPPYAQMRFVADAVAQAASEALKTISYRDGAPLHVREAKLSLGVRLPSADDVKRAEAIVAAAAGREMRTLPEIYARETLLLREYPARVEVPLQAIRIGDLAIVAIPCEAFVEVGLEIKRRSPFARTVVVDLANGYFGYLPTAAGHRLGGYETWRARSSFLEQEAAPAIVEALLALLVELKALPENESGRAGGRLPPRFNSRKLYQRRSASSGGGVGSPFMLSSDFLSSVWGSS